MSDYVKERVFSTSSMTNTQNITPIQKGESFSKAAYPRDTCFQIKLYKLCHMGGYTYDMYSNISNIFNEVLINKGINKTLYIYIYVNTMLQYGGPDS
jgi:hypothetical protein